MSRWIDPQSHDSNRVPMEPLEEEDDMSVTLPDYIDEEVVAAAYECNIKLEDIEDAYLDGMCPEDVARNWLEYEITSSLFQFIESSIDFEQLASELEGVYFIEYDNFCFSII